MKIYFAGSIRGGRGDVASYRELIRFLRSFGTVLTEHVGDVELSDIGDDGPNDPAIHDRDMAWLRSCDLMVAEVTVPSLGVGYELGRACALHKPTLALYRPQPGKRLSAMIAGSAAILTAEYDGIEQAQEKIREFIRSATHRKAAEVG